MRRELTYRILVLAGVLAAVATACSDTARGVRGDRRPPAGPSATRSRSPERLRFAYQVTRQPAAGLVAVFADRGAGSSSAIVLDADGGLPRPVRDGSLRVLDPLSGLVLFEAGSLDALGEALAATADAAIRIPLPVRVLGRVDGFSGRPDDVDVHHGSGARIAVTSYVRREQGIALQPSPDDNRAWGLDLPTIASRWAVTRPHADGAFDTGWLAIAAAPQLIAADRAGHVATLEVALPNTLRAHDLLNAGAIAPQPSAVVEIDRARLPATALPLVLQAGIDKAEVVAGSEPEAALRLVLLHRLDPRAAEFAMRRHDVDVALDGVTRIPGLPAFARLDLYVTGPRPGLVVRRTLTPGAAGAARVSLTQAELLGTPRRIPLTGRVRFEDGQPAAGASVVYSSYPDRAETRTDRAGAFAFPRVAAGREAVVFIDAPAGGKPPFDRITATQRFEIAADQSTVDVSIAIPRPLQAQVNIVRCPGGQPANVNQPIPYVMRTCGSRITQSQQLAFCPILAAYRRSGGTQELAPVDVAEIQVNPDGAEAFAALRVATPGTYTFVMSYTPFVYAQKEVVIDSASPVTVQFVPPDPWPAAVVVAVDPVGRPAADLEIAFPNWVEAADPFDGLTDQNGAMEVNCFNMDPVPGFVASGAGCFEGPIRLQHRGANVVLGSCEGL
jgi:hypothetical protein